MTFAASVRRKVASVNSGLWFAGGFRTPVQCAHRHSNLIRSAERDSDGFLKLESLNYFETPSPYGRRGQNGAAAPGRQKATKGGNEFVAICRLWT